MAPGKSEPARRPASVAETDAVLAVCRLLVAISVRSLAAATDEVDMVQLRILVVIASERSVTLSRVAEATQIHLSKASRTCDRLVTLGLIDKTDEPANRRSLRLTLTRRGLALVTRVMQARRDAIAPVLAKLAPAERARLIATLDEFSAAGGAPADEELWAMGWAT